MTPEENYGMARLVKDKAEAMERIAELEKERDRWKNYGRIRDDHVSELEAELAKQMEERDSANALAASREAEVSRAHAFSVELRQMINLYGDKEIISRMDRIYHKHHKIAKQVLNIIDGDEDL